VKQITQVIWGGKVMSIHYLPGENWCSVLFLSPEGCQAYYDSTRNGVRFPESSNIVQVERSVQPEPLNDFQRRLLASDVTRCVRLVGIPIGISSSVILKFAEEGGRQLENLLIGKDGATGVSIS
jgi:hypothetical protein